MPNPEQQAVRYIEGFLDGQVVAYCERVKTGMSMAAQLTTPKTYRKRLEGLIRKEGCNVFVEDYPGDRVSLWIYRNELAKRLILHLQSAEAPPSEFGIWSMGRLLGYANHEVAAFVSRRDR